MKQKLISQGAEAKIYLIEGNQEKNSKLVALINVKEGWAKEGLFEMPEENKIIKSRIAKSYRHPTLDNQIRTRRTKSECKILTKALQFGASVPRILNISPRGIPKEKFNLEIEYIPGDRLSETLNSYEEKTQFEIMKKIGQQIAILHKNDIIHGDLTTSNIILKEMSNEEEKDREKGTTKNGRVYLIDFGLSFISSKIEDKAVDLHLIKQALEAKHFQNHEDLFKNFCKGYSFEESNKVIERLKVVEKRGRYKH